ncbi:MAG: CBS domain-containing protein [Anaerolineales bacterium]|jgi:CBS domain-containing protein
MPTVKQILAKKGNVVWSIESEKHVYDALQLMAEKDIGALLVYKDKNVAGIITERDYARKVALKGKSAETIQVSDIMTSEVLCTSPNNSIEECMALMTDKKIRHLPVVDDGKIVGLISIGDVVKAIISQKEFVIEQLVNYIKGY